MVDCRRDLLARRGDTDRRGISVPGVLTRALLRYGALIGVVGSALIFALFHGINIVFPAALVAGLVTGELFRRSGSIWPGVIVHVIMNLPAIPMMVLASAAS